MNYYELFKSVVSRIIADPEEADAYNADPEGYLEDNGLADADLTPQQMEQAAAEVAEEQGLSEPTQNYLANYLTEPVPAPATPAPAPAAAAPAAAAPAPAPAPVERSAPPKPEAEPEADVSPIESIVQNMNYISYITNTVDNSTDIDVELDGEFHDDVKLDLDNEVTNANAMGQGSVAAGDDATGVATGDDALAVGGDAKHSNLNTGDGAVQAGDGIDGITNTGEIDDSVLVDGSAEDIIQGDGNVNADGEIGTAVTGDGNAVNTGEGNQTIGDGNTAVETKGGDAIVGEDINAVQGNSGDVNAAFGSGDVTDFGEYNDLEGVAVGGGDATNVDASEGSAVGFGSGDTTAIDAGADAVVGVGSTITNVENEGSGALAFGGDAQAGEGNTGGFGDGDISQANDNQLVNSSLAADGDATNEVDQVQVAGGGQANVATDGDAHLDQSVNDSFDTEDSFNTEDSYNVDDSFDTEDSYNTDDSHDEVIDITDSYDTEDSFNTEIETEVEVEELADHSDVAVDVLD